MDIHELTYDEHSDGIEDMPTKCLSDSSDCPCKRTKCQRHGNCASCREYHAVKGKPVACERSAKQERRRRER